MENLGQQSPENVCLMTSGTGIVSGLQLVDYLIEKPHPPKITLLWSAGDTDDRLKDALGRARVVAEAALVCDFRYHVLGDKADPQGDVALGTFLQLYHEKNIFHKKTVDALLSLVSREHKPDSQQNELVRAQGNHHVDSAQGLLIAVCGHSSFENNMTKALRGAGILESQIFRFLEGSQPMSQFSESTALSTLDSEGNGNDSKEPSHAPALSAVVDVMIGLNRKDKGNATQSGVYTTGSAVDAEIKRSLTPPAYTGLDETEIQLSGDGSRNDNDNTQSERWLSSSTHSDSNLESQLPAAERLEQERPAAEEAARQAEKERIVRWAVLEADNEAQQLEQERRLAAKEEARLAAIRSEMDAMFADDSSEEGAQDKGAV